MNYQDSKNDGLSLVRTALGISPLVAAAYYGGIQLKANQAINVPVGRSNPIQDLGRKIGAVAKQTSVASAKKLEKQVEGIKNDIRVTLGKSDSIQEIFKSTEQRNGLLQALAITLDDPALGIDNDKRMAMKQQILEASHINGPNQEKVVADMMRAIGDSADKNVIQRFDSLRNEYKKVGAELSAPTMSVPRSGVSYSVITDNSTMTKQENNWLKQIQDSLGHNYRVEPQQYNEFGKVNRVAKIYQLSKGGGESFRSSVPLTNNGFYRSGESGRTLYGMPRRSVDFKTATQIAERAGAKGTNQEAVLREFVDRTQRMPGFFTNELVQRARGGHVDWANFNSFMTGHMTDVERVAASNNPLSHHIRFQAESQINTLSISGLGRANAEQQRTGMARIAANLPFTDAGIGAKRLLSRSDEGLKGNIGLDQGSIFARFRAAYGFKIGGREAVDRSVLPLTMREHQLAGRPSAFIGGHYKIGATGITGGSIFNAAMADVGPNLTGEARHSALKDSLRKLNPVTGELTSGGLSSVYLMDVSKSGRISQGIGGSGMAYTGRSQLVSEPLQFPILDPEAHGYLETEILKKLRKGETLNFTLKELKNNGKGLLLGETSTGPKYLPFNERTREMTLSMQEVTEASVGKGTKKTLSIVGERRVEYDIFKLFDFLFKGNVQVTNDVMGLFDAASRKPVQELLTRHGIEAQSTIVTSSDMMSKGAGGFMHQIAGGTQLATRSVVTRAEIRDLAESIAASPARQIFGAAADMSHEKRTLAHYAQAAMELMGQHGIDAQDIGIVMSGVYHGAEGKGLSGHGLDPKAINTLAENLWGNGRNPEKLQAFKTGIAAQVTVGHSVGQLGDSVGGWGRARAGVEPRFAKTLHERLLGFGMSHNESSDIVAGLYKNKIGLGEHYALASQLVDMQTYVTGSQNAKEFITDGAKPRLNRAQLMDEVTKHKTLSDYLRKNRHGVILDLADTNHGNALKQISSSSELYLPGGDAFEAAKGTSIKQAGERSMIVESELGQLMEHLEGILKNPQDDIKIATKAMQSWTDSAQKMFLNVFDQLNSGKIKGGISPTAGLYDITHGVGMTTKTLQRARDVFFSSGGSAQFQTAEGFASQLADMKGSFDKTDLAHKARMFFTSMEQESSGKRFAGIVGIGGRHPQMTTGNVFMTQTFRHLEEIGHLGFDDKFFEKIASTEAGKQMIEEAGGPNKVRGFGDIAKLDSSKKKTFFNSFIDNLSHFTSGENADMMFYPNFITKEHGNIGIGIQAFLDNDGDHSLHFMLDSKASNSVMKQLKGSGKEIVLQDFKLRSFFNSMNQQTKKALDTAAADHGPMTDIQKRIFQDVQKEVGLAMETGPLDVNLRALHESFLMYGASAEEKGFGRMLIGNLQENFVIKSKKLPVYTGFAEKVQSATKRLMTTGNIDELSGFLRHAFRGQDIATGGMKIAGRITMADEADPAMKAAADEFFGMHNFETTYHLDQFLESAHRVANKAINDKTNNGLTKGQMGAMFADDPHSLMMAIRSGTGFNAASLEGFRGPDYLAKTSTGAGLVREALSRIDTHMTGKMAMGALASVALMGMVGNNTSPEPIIMPGENVSGGVLDSIRSGSLFDRKDPDISPEQFAPQPNQYDTMRPINTGVSYATRPNSYSIRGEVSSNSGLAQFSSYFNQLTGGMGRGNVSVNDQRRPITRNYVDRLLGL